MAFGFPYPRYKVSRTFDLEQTELFAVVQLALKDLGWPYKIPWGTEFEAQVPTTYTSWHHDLRVTFPSDSVIEAESKSSYRELFFDLGRNRRNVERFFGRVEQLIGQRNHQA